MSRQTHAIEKVAQRGLEGIHNMLRHVFKLVSSSFPRYFYYINYYYFYYFYFINVIIYKEIILIIIIIISLNANKTVREPVSRRKIYLSFRIYRLSLRLKETQVSPFHYPVVQWVPENTKFPYFTEIELDLARRLEARADLLHFISF